MNQNLASVDYVSTQLADAARTGQWLDMTAETLDIATASGHAADGTGRHPIPAVAIRRFLLSSQTPIDPRGLQIRGAVIVGVLDLAHAKLPCRLEFVNCHFEEIPIFEQTTLPDLTLEASTLPGIVLDSVQVVGNVNAKGIKTTGGVFVRNAHIGGQVSLAGAQISDVEGDALTFDGAEIKGGVFMDQLTVRGELRILGAHIGVQLSLCESKLTNPDGHALSLDGTEINGDLFMNELTAAGEVRAPGINLAGQLSLENAELTNPTGDALHLDSGKIGGDLIMSGAQVKGRTRALGVQIRGQAMLNNSQLENASGKALSLNAASIEGDLVMPELQATGEVRVDGARITGNLILTKAKLSNAGSVAISLDAADIKGSATLAKIETVGEIRGLGSSIAGSLSLMEAVISCPEQRAIYLDHAHVSGSVLMQKARISGLVRALGARIDGQLNFNEAKFIHRNGYGVSLDAARIQGGMFMLGTEISGQVRAVKADIGGQITLTDVKITGQKRPALNLSGATIGELAAVGKNACPSGLDLSFASIQVLSVAPLHDPIPLANVQGWSLGSIQGTFFGDRKAVARWLDTVDQSEESKRVIRFAAHPWKEIARIFDQMGHPERARWLRYQAAKRTTRISPWTSKVVRIPYAGFVGYGYYPGFLFVWLAAMLGIVFGLSALHPGAFTPTLPSAKTISIPDEHGHSKDILATGETQRPESYPAFSPILYAVDTAVPATATGQSNAWRVTANTWLPAIFSVIRGVSWVLTALLLAGITGILRKD